MYQRNNQLRPALQPRHPTRQSLANLHLPSDKPTESNVNAAKPEDSVDDLSTKPMDVLSISDAPAQQSESSAGSGGGPINWTWQDQKNIRMSGDLYHNSINGCCIMANGDLVLCDNNNQLIKSFHHKTGSNQGNMFLRDCPFDIAVLDDTTAIVTLPRQKKIQLIKVLPSLQKGNYSNNNNGMERIIIIILMILSKANTKYMY